MTSGKLFNLMVEAIKRVDEDMKKGRPMMFVNPEIGYYAELAGVLRDTGRTVKMGDQRIRVMEIVIPEEA